MRSRLLITALTGIILAAAAPAFAETPWEQTHPRRDQVNDRLANQSARIHRERAEGEMSARRAANLNRQDQRIRQEEHLMAAQNGGHITTSEQRVLNQQENRVSREIGR